MAPTSTPKGKPCGASHIPKTATCQKGRGVGKAVGIAAGITAGAVVAGALATPKSRARVRNAPAKARLFLQNKAAGALYKAGLGVIPPKPSMKFSGPRFSNKLRRMNHLNNARLTVEKLRRKHEPGYRNSKKPFWADGFEGELTAGLFRSDKTTFLNKKLHSRVKAEAKRKFKVYPSAYANAWMVREYKARGGKFRTDSLDKWFKEKWVRMSSSGEILGPCGDRAKNEGKPRCLPLAKAKALSKSQRASTVRKKRREDPSKNRRGSARMVRNSFDGAYQLDGGPSLSVGRGEKLSVEEGGGLTAKGRAKYNRETGSNLKAPVTGKVKPGSKAAKRRKSFCARSRSWSSPRGKAARRRWKC